MPNLHSLNIQGFIELPADRSSIEVELPVLQYLRIHMWGSCANHVLFNSPQLKRMTFFAPRVSVALLLDSISPQHLATLVRFSSSVVDNRTVFFFIVHEPYLLTLPL